MTQPRDPFGQLCNETVIYQGVAPSEINHIPVTPHFPKDKGEVLAVAGKLTDAHDYARQLGLYAPPHCAYLCFSNLRNVALEARELVASFKDLKSGYHVLIAKVWWKTFGCATWLVLAERKTPERPANRLWKYLSFAGVRTQDIQVWL